MFLDWLPRFTYAPVGMEVKLAWLSALPVILGPMLYFGKETLCHFLGVFSNPSGKTVKCEWDLETKNRNHISQFLLQRTVFPEKGHQSSLPFALSDRPNLLPTSPLVLGGSSETHASASAAEPLPAAGSLRVTLPAVPAGCDLHSLRDSR